ncbi:response regulator with CheY-like receiver domain and winged-helix DNA-binding domain [Desulfosporosinus orientis DSM 765]|uniref:Stage 0 sporulation protein A homolog n=1 Tax=Desulfosporosinus orientis (strain ATCC 19365 / DSM 765 / NCIMB 8382 / VKM B-1628 / Singapore I) TaxID=768706 RepID=G7WJ62_DESOD|nr:response regulator transcription factor [Desulfosporosinus orientis]AET70374.1 response regulator with CheY-like receiver domain and winged-helix DNA-binding domain [Desulfosporosinus orientis DSM 765]
MNIKVLVADDELLFRELVSDYLRKEGYVVLEAEDGEEAIDLFLKNTDINLLILDVMMPKSTGWEVCEEIRKISEVQILMLTALAEERDEIRGFDLGVNEYITKPFSYGTFMARVNSLLRSAIKEKEESIQIEGLRIDQSNKTVKINDMAIELSPKEYALLSYLVKNKGRALSRDQILNSVWGYDYYGDARTVDTHIKSLRASMQEYGQLIRTVRGIGYEMQVKND